MTNELVPYQDIEKMGSAVAKSGLFGVKTVEQAVALMLIAQAYGQHPAVAAMEYHIIEGKPSKKADAMLASFIQAGGSVKWLTLTDEKAQAIFSHPQGGTIELDWTIARAKQAGLVDKPYSNYKKYPRAMLRSRLISEGVKTIYPAATGGMLTPEEVLEVAETTAIDPNKSRVENIIEAHVETEVKVEKEEVKPKAEEKQSKEHKKSTNKDVAKSDIKQNDGQSVSSELPEDHKTVIGIIEGIPKSGEMPNPFNDNKPGIKHNFSIEGKKYGTFDIEMSKKIMECIDQKIMVKFEYKERVSGDKIFNDIVKFSQAVAGKDVLI